MDKTYAVCKVCRSQINTKSSFFFNDIEKKD